MGTHSIKSRNSELHTNLGLNEQPAELDLSEPPPVVSILATVIEKTIQKNDRFLKRTRTKDSVTIFHGSRAPALSIRQYIERIFKYSKCSPSCFVVAYIYLDKFLQTTNSFLTPLNAHRLLIACVMVAAKFLDDVSYNNAYYAKVGGVSIAEMNKLENKLLFSIDFRLYVTLETFDQYCQELEKEGTKTPNRSGGCQIERAIQACGFRGGWANRNEPKCTSKFAAYTCRAI